MFVRYFAIRGTESGKIDDEMIPSSPTICPIIDGYRHECPLSLQRVGRCRLVKFVKRRSTTPFTYQSDMEARPSGSTAGSPPSRNANFCDQVRRTRQGDPRCSKVVCRDDMCKVDGSRSRCISSASALPVYLDADPRRWKSCAKWNRVVFATTCRKVGRVHEHAVGDKTHLKAST
jgi:hypothetical protein